MGSYYEYAYLWQKGRSSLRNPYTLAAETVMTGAGEVFMGIFGDSKELVQRAVWWFYEDGLLILRDFGICSYLRSSFLRKVARKEEGNYCMTVWRKNRYTVFSRGEIADVIAVGRRNIVGCKGNFGSKGISGSRCVFGSNGVLLCSKNMGKTIGIDKMRNLLKESIKGKNSLISKNSAGEVDARIHEFARRCQSRGLTESMCAICVVRKKKKHQLRFPGRKV